MPATSGAGKRLVVVQSHQIAGSPGTTTLNALVAWGANNGTSVVNTPVVLDPVSGAFQQALIAPDYLLGSSTSSRSLIQSLTSRPGQDYLYSDGATANRRIETQYGALGAVAGSDLSLVDYVIYVPTSNLATNALLWDFVSTNTPGSSPVANSLVCTLRTIGSLQVAAFGAAGAADTRALDYASFRSDYSGRFVRITVAFSGNSTTSPTIYADGVDITSKFTLTTSGTVPNWVDTNLSATYFLSGYNWPAGYFRPGRPVNRKYAQSDVDFVQVAGKLPYSDAAGGSVANLITSVSRNSDFSAGATDWSSGFGAPGVAVVSNALQITYSGASQLAELTDPYFTKPSIARICRVQFTIVSNTVSGLIKVRQGVTNVLLGTFSGTGTFEFEFTQNTTGTQSFQLLNDSGNSGVLTVDNVVVLQPGALSDPIIQRCNVLDDATPNNKASLLVGFNPVTPKKDWRIPAYVDMSSTGNKQLLAGAVFDTPTAQAIDTIETTCAGTPTFSVGDGTTATKYTASVAHSAGRLRETLSANFPADSAKTGIYANVTVTGGGSELVIVRGHRE